jgi:geranylgeranyl pyrophosphate synthase
MDRRLDKLQARIRSAIGCHAASSIQRARLIDALSRPGYALARDSPCRAGTLSLAAYDAVRASLDDAAYCAAAAVELQTQAAFLFDNVADFELLDDVGYGAELALAIALSECASCVACEALSISELAGSAGRDALISFHRSCVGACAGQLLDALFEGRDDVTAREALEMTLFKSGNFGRLAAGFGARLAAADAEVVADLEELGRSLFTFAQLIDDLRDACSTDLDDDWARGKKTVPLAFFHERCECPLLPSNHDMMRLSRDARHRYRTGEAPLFGALVAEAFFERARRTLERLRGKPCKVMELDRLVESLDRSFSSVLRSIEPARCPVAPRDADGRVRGPRDVRGSRDPGAGLGPARRRPRPDARAS